MSGIIGSAGAKSGIIGVTELDYEVGSNVVTVTMGGGQTIGLNASFQTLFWTRIGRMCFITGEIRIASAAGSPSGECSILNLPFLCSPDPNTSGFGVASYDANWGSSATQMYGIVMTSNNMIRLYGAVHNAARTFVIPAAGDEYYFNCSYQIAGT